jgi:hypothetical protein
MTTAIIIIGGTVQIPVDSFDETSGGGMVMLAMRYKSHHHPTNQR